MAAITSIGDNAIDSRPELLIHPRDERRQSITIIKSSKLGFDVSDKLAACRAIKRCRNRDFDAKLISPTLLTFADAFSLWSVEAVDFLSRPEDIP